MEWREKEKIDKKRRMGRGGGEVHGFFICNSVFFFLTTPTHCEGQTHTPTREGVASKFYWTILMSGANVKLASIQSEVAM